MFGITKEALIKSFEHLYCAIQETSRINRYENKELLSRIEGLEISIDDLTERLVGQTAAIRARRQARLARIQQGISQRKSAAD